MCNRKFNPGFGANNSILDGACKYENEEVIQKVLGSMVEKGLISKLPSFEYGSIVQKVQVSYTLGITIICPE